jgi:hypothetical protein
VSFASHPIFYTLMALVNFATFARELRRWPKQATTWMWVKAIVAAAIWPVVAVFLLAEAYAKAWRGER